jgi:hypothetical protein
MPGRIRQRKPGTARGSPRRSRTAKAVRISRKAAKSRCACERDGWGRLSDDGPRQHNSVRSEDPWGRWNIPPHGGALTEPTGPTPSGAINGGNEVREGRVQTGRRVAYAGSRLKLFDAPGRPCPTGQPWSRTGENPPYGILGGIEETSASFEARSAPRSHPTMTPNTHRQARRIGTLAPG